MGSGVLDEEKHLHSSRLNKQVLWAVHNHLPDLVPDLSVESFEDVNGYHVGRFVAVIDNVELAAHHFELCLQFPVVGSLLLLGGQLYFQRVLLLRLL